jgi:hypothetical protein
MSVRPRRGRSIGNVRAASLRIQDVQASHAVFMTQPKAAAEVIDRAARHVGSTK